MNAPAIHLPQPGDLETLQKMQMIRALGDAIEKARDNNLRLKTHASAVLLQQRVNEREELRRSLPPLRIVE